MTDETKIISENETNRGPKCPWLNYMGETEPHLDYFRGTMFEAFEKATDCTPDFPAMYFMGKKITYREMMKSVLLYSRALVNAGVRKGDAVTVALPNCPQAVNVFYALNYIGAVGSMIHPLSGENEIRFYAEEAKSKLVITLDQFYEKFERALRDSCAEKIIFASVRDELMPFTKIGYDLTAGRKNPKFQETDRIVKWKSFIKGAGNVPAPVKEAQSPDDVAVILYSGGTTGKTKGILLTNFNFNALGAQIVATNKMFRPGDRMLAAMPIFHGFGLGVCIHSMIVNSGCCVLVPRFTPKSYAKLIVKYKCNFIAGVPTLFEALLRINDLDGKNLSFLKGVFSGGDSLPPELKKKIDCFLRTRKSNVSVREGYGTTETVTACCLTPAHFEKEGSIGIAFPDTYIKIVKPGTAHELEYGTEGEILLAGPTVMKGYMNNEEETAKTLEYHPDGQTWVRTGDLGYMDEDGFIYFKGRIKRMIVSSGYNIYPAQLENILDSHELVHMSCVIGIPDTLKMQKVKAFIMLKENVPESEETRKILLDFCRKNMARYAIPAEIEFRKELPKTLVGKIAYKVLEEEEKQKTKQ